MAVYNPYKKQLEILKTILKRKSPFFRMFGIERLMTFFLVGIQFFFPSMIVRWSGGNSTIRRRKAVEYFRIFKIILLIELLFLPSNIIIVILVTYILLDGFFYLLNVVLLDDIYGEPISVRRGLFLFFLSLLEFILCYSILYTGSNSIVNTKIPNLVLHGPIHSVYFSVATFTSLGDSDYSPYNALGKFLVMSQLIVGFIYVGIIIVYYVTRKFSDTK